MRTFFYMTMVIALLVSGCKKEVKEDVRMPDKPRNEEIKSEKVTINTSDNIKLAGNYYYAKGKEQTREPLIVLIHQFKASKEQWPDSFIDSLVSKNYKVITYDIRSHGESDIAKVKLDDILTNPEQAPKDVDAVLKWAYNNAGIDTTKIGFAGTSIGGALGFYGKLHGGKSVVMVSTGNLTFAPLTGYDDRKMSMSRPLLKVRNVFMIAGDKDGNHAYENKNIYDTFLDDPREMKFYPSDKHGKELIQQYPEIYSLIINWFGKTL
ncbi:MAG: alpha/beta hydrolase [Bacteroidetes bacterium]|nr:alpha/beta hydrolase [Bacteroidota bacterium]